MSESLLLDRRWIARGAERTSTVRFVLWLLPWIAVLLLGIYAAGLCLYYGLNQTNMDNRFAFGLWIFADLSIIAMGAGAFFTGFLVHILKQDDLEPLVNSAVVVGLTCYSGAMAVLMVDVGQPLRAWFTFWYPNTHSMLTEVTFCISCYLLVLILEYVPLLLRNRQFRKIPSFLIFEHQFHKLVPVLAGVGAFLSFFHQGSLGGLYGVLRGRPFAYRQGFAIWPSTFFLFILSAIAVGPSFLMLVTATAEKITGRQLVAPRAYRKLGFISGILLALYVVAKAIDTYIWLNITSLKVGFRPWDFYAYQPISRAFLFLALVPLGLVPAILLILPYTARKRGWLLCGATLTCCGVLLNRFVMTLQTLGLPTLSFDEFLLYLPSWQEVATFAAVVAYGVILYSLSYRYLPLFESTKGVEKHVSLD
jgi:menaquinone reductase, integral membrane subunit